jgi:cytochrome c-type protein NapB
MRRESYTGMSRAKRAALLMAVIAVGMGLPSAAIAQDPIATLRNWVINKEPAPPPTPKISNTDLRQGRNYPEQPPVIPHSIRGYQIDLNSNRCLMCHSRKATELSQAPMVSVTHFMARDGQVLTSVSPRRFFCTQCHVTQLRVRPLVGNTFIDVDSLIDGVGKKKGN